MSSRAELERRIMQDSNSPLVNHSMSDNNIKRAAEGWSRSQRIPRKVERANLRRERIMQQLVEERIQRIQTWLFRALNTGYGIVDYPQEIAYLRKHGIRVFDAPKN